MRIHRHRVRKPKYNIPVYKVNEQIKVDEVRVLDQDNKQIGILKTADALQRARAAQLDLVEVSPKAKPPVCRFMDYGQFKYQKEKEAKKQKTKSKEVEVKGIRLSVRIGEHDMQVRLKQALKFLERGDKLKIELAMRGREKAHAHVAKDVINLFIEKIKEKYEIRIEQPVTRQGGRLTIIVARQ